MAAASSSYFDSYRTANLPQNLTQAQRDFFGSHTYQRVDKPGRRPDPHRVGSRHPESLVFIYALAGHACQCNFSSVSHIFDCRTCVRVRVAGSFTYLKARVRLSLIQLELR